MPTYTSQPDEVSGIDTFMAGDVPDSTQNGSYMQVGERNNGTDKHGRALIKFDLSSIPLNASVISATLTITPIVDYSDNTRTLRIYRQKRDWDETATWNSYKTGSAWQTAGGFGANDCEQTDVGTVSIASNQAVNTGVDISINSSSVTDMVTGSWSNNGWLLKVDTESNDGFHYASSAHATASYRPKLVIVYTLPQTSGKPIFANFGIV